MRLTNAQDPRWVLCKQKYFGLRPEPLEQYVYSLDLPRVAERVFWIHWDTGARRGDFTSELSLREVARRCHCDASSVTRAYQALKRAGLVRRQDPGRDPRRPFEQAIALTEVLIPSAALSRLLAAQNRREAAAEQPSQPAAEVSPAGAPAPISAPPKATTASAEVVMADPSTYWPKCIERLQEVVAEKDFHTWVRPLQPYAANHRLVLFAPNPFVVNWLKENQEGLIRSVLAELAPDVKGVDIQVGTRPKKDEISASIGVGTPARVAPRLKPRELTPFLLAKLRHRLSELTPSKLLDDRYREAVWSIEEGPLLKLDPLKAINTTVKLVRLNLWRRPHRMPTNWQRSLYARPETCRAA